jgi:hypothetical protein
MECEPIFGCVILTIAQLVDCTGFYFCRRWPQRHVIILACMENADPAFADESLSPLTSPRVESKRHPPNVFLIFVRSGWSAIQMEKPDLSNIEYTKILAQV